MNRPRQQPTRVVASQEEAAAVEKAEHLAAKGPAAFGDPKKKFDLNADMADQQSFGFSEPMARQTEDPVTNEENEEQEELKKPMLSEDPVERMRQVSELIRKDNPSFPSFEKLIEWKRVHKDIFIVDLGDNIFVYRYLKRQEWIQIQASESFNSMRQDQKESMFFDKCVLWPSHGPADIAALPAGCISTIVSQIERQSMFLDPREVAAVTIKL